MNALVQVQGLKKTYQTGSVHFEALRGVSLDIEQGDFVAIMGESGSGKSTLLHIVGGLDQPTTGSVMVGAQCIDSMSETKLAIFRRAEIGFVFQFFNLVENINVRANVELPALLEGRKKKEIRQRSTELLERLGIIDQAALLLRVPLSTTRACYWLTNRLATSTVLAATKCWKSCVTSMPRDRPS
jgi:putative ABC transport system ATP-binding protein